MGEEDSIELSDIDEEKGTGLRHRKNDYQPKSDIALLALAGNTRKRQKTRKRETKNKCNQYLSRITAKLDFFNPVIKLVNSMDRITTYRPFEIFRHYYVQHTTGLSLVYLLVGIFIIMNHIYMIYKRPDTVLASQFGSSADIPDLEIPPLTGLAFVPSASYSGSVVISSPIYYLCSEDFSSSSSITRSCTQLTSQTCASLAPTYGLSTAETAIVTNFAFTCVSTDAQVAAQASNGERKYIYTELKATGSKSDINTMLQSGGQVYWIGSAYSGNSDSSTFFVENGIRVIPMETAANTHVKLTVEYMEVISRSIQPGFGNFDRIEDKRLFNSGVHQNSIPMEFNTTSHTSATFVSLRLLPIFPYGTEQFQKRIITEEFAAVSGVIFFLWFVGALIRLYNRWSFRGDPACMTGGFNCCRCCSMKELPNCCDGQLHGGKFLSSNIGHSQYTNKTFAKLMGQYHPNGYDIIIDKGEEQTDTSGTWRKTAALYKDCEELRARLKNLVEQANNNERVDDDN